MELVDMSLPKKSEAELKKDYAPCCEPIGQDKWPYGLQLRFEKEQVDKMPNLTDYKVGDRIAITAEAVVTEVRMVERQNDKESYTVEMQIEKIGCELAVTKPLDKMSPQEYRKARMGK